MSEAGPPLILTLITTAVPLLFVVALLAFSIRVVHEHERAVVFRLGRVIGAPGPGLVFVLPFVDRAVRVDLRTQTAELSAPSLRTADGAPVQVRASLTYRVVDPVQAVIEVQDYHDAILKVGQAALHQVVRQFDLDQLRADRPLADDLLGVLTGQEVVPWGLEIQAATVDAVERAPD